MNINYYLLVFFTLVALAKGCEPKIEDPDANDIQICYYGNEKMGQKKLDSILVVLYEEMLRPDMFVFKTVVASREIKTNPVWMILSVKWISNFDPLFKNDTTGGVGIIEFLPEYLSQMGLKEADILALDENDQMALVPKYYSLINTSAVPLDCVEKVFAIHFYPYLLNVWTNDEFVIGSEKSEDFAKQFGDENPQIDIDSNGYIKLCEFRSYVKNTINMYYSQINFANGNEDN